MGKSCKVTHGGGGLAVCGRKGNRCYPCCTWQMGLLVFRARLSLKGDVGCQGLGWHGANPSVTTLSVPCSWLSISQPRGGLGDRGRHRSPADLLHGPFAEPEAQPRWVTSRDPSCFNLPLLLWVWRLLHRQKDGNPSATAAAAGRHQSLLRSRLLLLSGGASQQRMKCILMFCWRLLPGTGVY